VIENDMATKQDIKDLQATTQQDIKTMRQEMLQMEYRLTIKLGTIVTVIAGLLLAAIKLL
jgi:hypothetical protein